MKNIKELFWKLKTKNMSKKKRNAYFMAGSIITGLILLMVIIGLFYTPYPPTKMDASAKLQGISLKHIMGTDNMGRDVFSRVMYGSRITLIIAIGTVAFGTICSFCFY